MLMLLLLLTLEPCASVDVSSVVELMAAVVDVSVDTIRLLSGGSPYMLNTTVSIRRNVTLESSSDVILDAQRRFTVIEVNGSAVEVTLRGLHIVGGDAGGANGGGLRITEGASVTVDGCVFDDCHAECGACYGGAIDAHGTPSTLSRLTVTGGTVIRNCAAAVRRTHTPNP
jgi:hypothetical protein